MSFCEFVGYVGGAGINAAVGFVLSVVLELWPAFETMLPRQKRLVVMGLTFALPLVSLVGQIGACGARFEPEMVWSAVQAGFVAFFTSQGTHAAFLPSRRHEGGPATRTSTTKALTPPTTRGAGDTKEHEGVVR